VFTVFPIKVYAENVGEKNYKQGFKMIKLAQNLKLLKKALSVV
jgi:hypothetical protein